MIDLADSKLDDRVIQHLMKDPEGDGGQWSMASNLVEKYGLVPQAGEFLLPVVRNRELTPSCAVFPESFNSSATRQLDGLLTSKLREYALELRKEYRAALKSVQSTSPHQSPAQQKSSAQQSVRRRKQEQVRLSSILISPSYVLESAIGGSHGCLPAGGDLPHSLDHSRNSSPRE